MRVRTLVALAHAGIASGLVTREEVFDRLCVVHVNAYKTRRLERFRVRGIGEEEAKKDPEIGRKITECDEIIQLVSTALRRL